jgi:hypothetical protein
MYMKKTGGAFQRRNTAVKFDLPDPVRPAVTHHYEIDWDNFEQVNINTGVCRQIIRKEAKVAPKTRKSLIQSIDQLVVGGENEVNDAADVRPYASLFTRTLYA